MILIRHPGNCSGYMFKILHYREEQTSNGDKEGSRDIGSSHSVLM